MGLSISHDSWEGSYSSFHVFRRITAQLAGYPPLDFMEGYYGSGYFDIVNNLLNSADKIYENFAQQILACLPIKWDMFKSDPLINLLIHSDCEGTIRPKMAARIANRLEQLLHREELHQIGNKDEEEDFLKWSYQAKRMINGFKLAATLNERVVFS